MLYLAGFFWFGDDVLLLFTTKWCKGAYRDLSILEVAVRITHLYGLYFGASFCRILRVMPFEGGLDILLLRIRMPNAIALPAGF